MQQLQPCLAVRSDVLGGWREARASSVWPDVREKLKVSYDLVGAVKLEFGPKARYIEFLVLSICKK